MKQLTDHIAVVVRTRQFRILVLVFVIALVVRLFVLAPVTASHAVESGNDAQGYLKRAVGFEHIWRSLATGHLPAIRDLSLAYTSAWPPVQSFLLSLGFVVLGPELLAGRLVMILLSALTTPFVYLVTEKLASRRAALLASLVFALYPGFVHFSLRLFSETAFILVLFVMLLFVLLMMEAKDTRRAAAFAVAAGFFLGLEILTRAIAVVWLPVLVLWVGWRFPRQGSRLLVSALVLGATLLTLLPWEATLFAIEGRVMVITKTGDLSMYLGNKLNLPNNPRLAVAAVSTDEANPQDEPLKNISNPRLEMPKAVREWSRTWNSDFTLYRYLFMLGYPPLSNGWVISILLLGFITFLLFMVLALWGLLNPSPALRYRSLIVSLIAVTTVTYLFTHGQSRYSMPLLALLLPAVGHGLAQRRALFARTNRAWSLAWLGGVTVLGVSMYVGLPYEYGTVAPSSYYANLVRQLDPLLGNQLLVSDRLVFRAAGNNPPASVSLSLPGSEFEFVDTADPIIQWNPAVLQVTTVAAQSRTATEPLQLQVTSGERGKPALITLKREAWRTWQPIPGTGIEYMWIGSAGFSRSDALDSTTKVAQHVIPDFHLLHAPTSTIPTASKESFQNFKRGSVPSFDHIFIIVAENQPYEAIIGNPAFAYFNSLAEEYGLAKDYSAITHPSLPNYLALIGGDTFGINSNCKPDPNASDYCHLNVPNLADRLEDAGKTWKSYNESMPSPCLLESSGDYVPRHNPFLYFDDIRTDAPRCTTHVVPLTALKGDLALATTTPNFVWIKPDLCNDTTRCSSETVDTWVKDNLAVIFRSPAWTHQNSVIFFTWDEGEGVNQRLATLILGPSVKSGYESNVRYNHYSLLRTFEEAWGLAPLTANDADASAMTDFWR